MAALAWKAAWQAQDLRGDLDMTVNDLRTVLSLAEEVKRQPHAFTRTLTGKYLSLLFEKPSLRTRFTFELAIKQLGGDAVTSIGPIADREPLKDVARNLDRWTHGIVARTFSQDTIDGLAEWAGVPVINALSDLYHPCQALADLQTIKETFGRWDGIRIAYVGDGNNVAHSLLLNGLRLGCSVSVATPAGYSIASTIQAQGEQLAHEHGTQLQLTTNPAEAVQGAHVVYTDVWASMGQESEAEQRKAVFAPYQVTAGLLAQARPEAIFLHCLPAKRGQEVTDEVVESAQSLVFTQAENRLHAQKALLLLLLG